jgi:hypothetical protein
MPNRVGEVLPIRSTRTLLGGAARRPSSRRLASFVRPHTSANAERMSKLALGFVGIVAVILFAAFTSNWIIVACFAGYLIVYRPMAARWPAQQWLDHANLLWRWVNRLCLALACMLLPLSLSWLAANILLVCCANVFTAIPLGVLRFAGLAVTAMLWISLYLLIAKHIRERPNASQKSAA